MIVGQVRETKPLSETCPHCRTHFTRPWSEVTHSKTGVLHQFYIRWTDCSKCGRFILALEEQVGAATDAEQQAAGRHWEWKTVTSVILWPQPKPADNDPLTGLARKSTFEAVAPKAIAGAVNTGAPLSLVLLDLDDFKAVNSGPEGLLAGDEILRAVGPIISETTRGKGSARAYRWGGEEFVVILPDFDVDEATAVAQRLRRAVAAKPLGNPPRTITASIGVSTAPEHGTDLKTLFDAADQALKKAKAQGKNRVNIAESARSA